MPSITIINQPIYNRGDQAAFRGLVKLLQGCPYIDTTVLFCYPEQAVRTFMEGVDGVKYVCFPGLQKGKKFFKRIMYLPKPFRRVVELLPEVKKFNRCIGQADYVVCAPGGIDIGGYQNWRVIWRLTSALGLKKRTGIYGRSIGPFRKKKISDHIFARRAIEVLGEVDYLSLRDKRSQEIAEELGISYVPSIDSAFAYRPDCDIPAELSFLRELKYAVFVPNQLYATRNFKIFKRESFDIFYRSIIDKILSRGYSVVMVPQLFGRNEGDRPYFEYLAGDYESDEVFVVSDIYDSDIQQSIISNASFLVGARCHSIIFAINNHTPFLCLSYEHKMSGALQLLGLSRYLLPLRELLGPGLNDGIQKVHTLLDTVVDNRLSILPEIRDASLRAQEIIRNAFSKFLSTLNETIEGNNG
jgi:colanic acid/amylovoran biosynthesis protein